MTDAQTIDGTAEAEVIDENPTGTALAHRQTTGTLAVAPDANAADLVARVDLIREAMTTAMRQDVDYGVIPGTGTKPTLLKPGAEKLGVLFQLDVQIVNEKVWGPGDHLTVMSSATVYHAPTGARLGFGEGLCTTREKKYAKRKQERTCPTCGAAAVIKGKAEFGGGWLCWKKRDGCGAKFNDGDPAIEGQDVGEIDNPDLADVWNTCIKMAEKRARVDAILAVTGASALFTQDVEDQPAAVESVPAGRPFGRDASRELIAQAKPALTRALGTKAAAERLWTALRKRFDASMPEAATVALLELAGAVASDVTPADAGSDFQAAQPPVDASGEEIPF